MIMENKFNIRPARADEAGLVLEFIKKLAAYEKEDLIKMSEAYEKNHGNSYVQDIVNEMRHWDLAM